MSSEFRKDYLEIYKEKLQLLYGRDLGESLLKLINQISILLYVMDNEEELNRLLVEKKETEDELAAMNNRVEYLGELAERKKELTRKSR